MRAKTAKRRNKGGGNCGNSGNSKQTNSKQTAKKCLSASGSVPITIPPPQPIRSGDEEMSIILSKIVKAKKAGSTIEEALNIEEKKAYDNYLTQKKERDLKFKAKQEEAERKKQEAKLEESRRKEEAKLEELRRKEEISKMKIEIEKRMRLEREEKKQKLEEQARNKLETETRMKEEAANAQIAIYKKANPSRVDLLIQNFGKSSNKRSRKSKGGKKRATRRKT